MRKGQLVHSSTTRNSLFLFTLCGSSADQDQGGYDGSDEAVLAIRFRLGLQYSGRLTWRDTVKTSLPVPMPSCALPIPGAGGSAASLAPASGNRLDDFNISVDGACAEQCGQSAASHYQNYADPNS